MTAEQRSDWPFAHGARVRPKDNPIRSFTVDHCEKVVLHGGTRWVVYGPTTVRHWAEELEVAPANHPESPESSNTYFVDRNHNGIVMGVASIHRKYDLEFVCTVEGTAEGEANAQRICDLLNANPLPPLATQLEQVVERVDKRIASSEAVAADELPKEFNFNQYMTLDRGLSSIKQLFDTTSQGRWYWNALGLVVGGFDPKPILWPSNVITPERDLDGTRPTAETYWQNRIGSCGLEVEKRAPENAVFLGEAHGIVEWLLKQIEGLPEAVARLRSAIISDLNADGEPIPAADMIDCGVRYIKRLERELEAEVNRVSVSTDPPYQLPKENCP